MKIFKLFVYVFAIIGVLSVCYFIIEYKERQARNKMFLDNCSRVKIGMDLSLARTLLGEFDDSNFLDFKHNPAFFVLKPDSLSKNFKYYLEYEIVDKEQGGVTLEFNPITNEITGCKSGTIY